MERPLNIWDELSREWIWRALQALGKRVLGLFRKNRKEANVAGARERGKWLETRSGRWQGPDQLRIHSDTWRNGRFRNQSPVPPNAVEINWPMLKAMPCPSLLKPSGGFQGLSRSGFNCGCPHQSKPMPSSRKQAHSRALRVKARIA